MAMPEHPRGSTVRTDELGSYVAYHRRCNMCSNELTSRNRPSDGTLRCKNCTYGVAREVYEARVKQEKPPKPPAPPTEAPVAPPEALPTVVPAVKATRMKKPPGGPERQAIHKLLTAFLAQPKIKEHKDKLLDALVTHELIERFRTL